MTLKTVQKLSIFTLLLMGLTPPGFAFNPAVDDPKLEASAERYKAATSEYKELLKAKRDFVEAKIKRSEELLVAEENGEKRRLLVGRLAAQKAQGDEIGDKLRVISAGEVVKLSNKKNKIIAFLTGN